jgi:hypothetical protein
MVGFNNFGTGRGATAALASQLSDHLRPIDGIVIASFGSTIHGVGHVAMK